MMRGPQAVGKSSLAKALGLENNVLSTDDLRMTLGAPELNALGQWSIPQERGFVVWSMMEKLCGERMERGETIVLDAMFLDTKDVDNYLRLAADNDYKCLLADFTDFPIDEAVARDALRPVLQRVGEMILRRSAKAFVERKIRPAALDGVVVEKWEPVGREASLAKRIMAWLEVPVVDLSSYDSVCHIGDLQGCFTVLAGPGGPLEHGLDPAIFYIFSGDLLDRGKENGKVLAWFKREVHGKPNAALLWGNHEDHLWRFGMGRPAVSHEFSARTQPQLEAEGLGPEDAKAIVAAAKEIYVYQWRSRKVVVTHAGLPGLPPLSAAGEPQWHLLARSQLSKGAGNYSDPVDKIFSQSQQALPEADRWTQVHGHRNAGVGMFEFPGSINLEDGVEFGGKLRMADLSAAGWTGRELDNKIYSTWRQRFSGSKLRRDKNKNQKKGDPMSEEGNVEKGAESEVFAFDVKAVVPAWITEPGSAAPVLGEATLADMRAHDGVMEKTMPDRPWVSSLSFTRDVFFDKKWDDVVVKARGLFFNNQTREVVARGYEKFFNIGERPETELSSLEKTLVFPVVGYLKENGFLGNLGYDAAKDELMWASKSTTKGDFAAWFKEIFESSVSAERAEAIKRYLRDAEASLVFEVIDPVRDPHMIDYPQAKLVLLDIFHRSEDGRKLAYEELVKTAKVFGLEPKQRMFEFKTMDALRGWMRRAHADLSYRHSGNDIEGVVFEDVQGAQTKCKLPHYGFWKSMRSRKDRLVKLAVEIRRLRDAGATLPEEGSAKPAQSDAEAWASLQALPTAEERSAKMDEIMARKANKPAPPGKNGQALVNALASWERNLTADDHPLAQSFMKWCAGKDPKEIGPRSIIELRKLFDAEVGIKKEWMAVSWDRFDPSEKEGPRQPKAAPADLAEDQESAPAQAAKRGPKM